MYIAFNYCHYYWSLGKNVREKWSCHLRVTINIIIFMPSVANVLAGLKYKKNVSERLGFGVKFCLLRKAAMKADAVKAMDSDKNSLKKLFLAVRQF